MKKPIILFLGLMLSLISCTEDKYITPENPYTKKIESFTVTNSNEPIKVVISEERKEIVLILPYYLGLTAIELDIKLKEGFTIIEQPENTLIKDVREYLLENKPALTYRIKDTENNTLTYTLKIETYQEDIIFPEQPQTSFTRTAIVDWGRGPELSESRVFIKSQNIIKRINGHEITKVFFIDKNNKEYELNKVSTSRTGISGYFPEGMELGMYTIRVENSSKKTTLEGSFEVIRTYGEI